MSTLETQMTKRRIVPQGRTGNPVPRLCITCGQTIHAQRVALLPDTLTCVGCSEAEPITEDEAGLLDGADQAELDRMTQNDGERR